MVQESLELARIARMLLPLGILAVAFLWFIYSIIAIRSTMYRRRK